MKLYQNHTLKEYIEQLSAKTPVPGGGSAAALTASLGAALLSMVAEYSVGKIFARRDQKKMETAAKKAKALAKEFLRYVDLDAEAYLEVVKSRKAKESVKKAALKKAQHVPLQVCRLCYQGLDLAPFLVQKGNPYLLSDVEVAVEMLLAAYRSAMINVKINQT